VVETLGLPKPDICSPELIGNWVVLTTIVAEEDRAALAFLVFFRDILAPTLGLDVLIIERDDMYGIRLSWADYTSIGA